MNIIIENIEEKIWEEIKEGTVIVTKENEFFLVVKNQKSFNVFDLETMDLYCYNSQYEFEEEYRIDEIYQHDKVEIILNK